MSGYAIRNDGMGYRWVTGEDDLFENEHFSTTPPSSDPSVAIRKQISDLETQITLRRLREAILGIDNGWLENIENQIAALRVQL